MQPRILQGEAVGVHGDRLTAQQAHDRVQTLLHPRPLVVGGNPEHVCVGRQLAGPAAEHHAAAGQVVEQNHAVGQHQRVVIRQGIHAGAELDVLGAFGGHGDHHLGGGDELEPGRVMLADPRLVEAEPVHRDDQVEITFDGQRRVLPGGMERCQEVSEAHRTSLRPNPIGRIGFGNQRLLT